MRTRVTHRYLQIAKLCLGKVCLVLFSHRKTITMKLRNVMKLLAHNIQNSNVYETVCREKRKF